MEVAYIQPPRVNVWPANLDADEALGSFSCIDLAVSDQGGVLLAAGCGESICIFASSDGDSKLECVSLLQPSAGRILQVAIHSHAEMVACLCFSEVVVLGLMGLLRNRVLRCELVGVGVVTCLLTRLLLQAPR